MQWFSLYILHRFHIRKVLLHPFLLWDIRRTIPNFIRRYLWQRVHFCVYSSMPQAAEKRAHLNRQTTWCQPLQYYPVLKCLFMSSVDNLSSFCNMLLQVTFISVLFWSYCEIFHEKPLLLVYRFLLSNCKDSLSFFNYTQANRTFFYSRPLLYISIKFGRILLNI